MAVKLAHGATLHPICTATGKRSYPSARATKRATAAVGNRIRVYLCPECHGWHATSEIRRDRDGWR